MASMVQSPMVSTPRQPPSSATALLGRSLALTALMTRAPVGRRVFGGCTLAASGLVAADATAFSSYLLDFKGPLPGDFVVPASTIGCSVPLLYRAGRADSRPAEWKAVPPSSRRVRSIDEGPRAKVRGPRPGRRQRLRCSGRRRTPAYRAARPRPLSRRARLRSRRGAEARHSGRRLGRQVGRRFGLAWWEGVGMSRVRILSPGSAVRIARRSASEECTLFGDDPPPHEVGRHHRLSPCPS